jgi:hypothetical protein
VRRIVHHRWSVAAIVVGEPQRVFYDNQLTYPLFVR